MATNIEIKARIKDWDSAVKAAEAVSDSPRQVIEQEDVFFRVAEGRLKLRYLGPQHGELIAYRRPDASGPKSSQYEIFRTAEPDSLREVLAASLGERGSVRKTRWLYLAGRTRIHLDRVEGLGEFLELEVVLAPGQPQDAGMQTARDLMAALGVHESDLIEGAYLDLQEAYGR